MKNLIIFTLAVYIGFIHLSKKNAGDPKPAREKLSELSMLMVIKNAGISDISFTSNADIPITLHHGSTKIFPLNFKSKHTLVIKLEPTFHNEAKEKELIFASAQN